MNRPSVIRSALASEVLMLIRRMRILFGTNFPDEGDVLAALDPEHETDLQVDVVNVLMVNLGHVETSPTLPKYDKTRRAVNAKKLKGPRGMKFAGEPTDADALKT